MVKNLIKHLQVPNRFILNIGINPAILLTELIDKERYLLNEWKLDKDNYFFHEYKYIYKNTALLKSKFNSAKTKLLELWIISIKYGEWKRLLYKINNLKILEIFFPNSLNDLSEDDFLELILENGYVFYPAVLAHKLWINETIFIKSLLSKRNSFLNKNQLINWYFFNSVSNIKNDTSLSRDQQLKCIKTLVDINLIDVKYDYDNTRYFCINIAVLSKFESIDLNELLKEAWKHDEAEVWNNNKVNKSKIILINPFNNNDDWKHDEVEVWNNNELESWNLDITEEWITDKQKGELSPISSLNYQWVEDWKDYINKNKNKNKQIKEINNTKKLLMWIFNNILLVNKLLQEYDETTINKVIQESSKRKVDNIPWFIRWSLENNIDFTSASEVLEKKHFEYKKKELISNNIEENSRNKLIIEKKLYYEWKNNNSEEYTTLFEGFKNELNYGNINAIKLNINAELKTKQYVLSTYFNNM